MFIICIHHVFPLLVTLSEHILFFWKPACWFLYSFRYLNPRLTRHPITFHPLLGVTGPPILRSNAAGRVFRLLLSTVWKTRITCFVPDHFTSSENCFNHLISQTRLPSINTALFFRVFSFTLKQTSSVLNKRTFKAQSGSFADVSHTAAFT